MEFYMKLMLFALLAVSSAFLMPDVPANETLPFVSTSNVHSNESIDQRLQDLMTLLIEEKRLRYSLEQRVVNTEYKQKAFDKFREDITAELQLERNNVQRLEQSLKNATATIDNLVNDIQIERFNVKTMDNILNNATFTIDTLVKDVESGHALVKTLENSLKNANSTIDTLLKDVQIERLTIKLLEIELNNATSVIETLVKDRQADRNILNHLEGSVKHANDTIDTLLKDIEVDRNSLHHLEASLNNATDAIASIVKDGETEHTLLKKLENDLYNATSTIDTLVKDRQSEQLVVSKLEVSLVNVTSTVGKLVNDVENELTSIKGLEISLINATSSIDNVIKEALVDRNMVNTIGHLVNASSQEYKTLVEEVQSLNLTYKSILNNMTEHRKDNMVAFSVTGPNSDHSPQRFVHANFEIGGDYNISSGVFVCKRPGVYVFMWTAVQSRSGSAKTCCLYINGYRFQTACSITGGGTGEHPSGSRSVIARLDINYDVYLDCPDGSFYQLSGFSGFLLYPYS